MSLSNLRKFNRNKGLVKVTPVLKHDSGRIGVMLAVPTLSGNVNWSIAHQFGMAGMYNGDSSCPYFFQTVLQTGTTPVEYARNCIVEQFLERSQCEWLYMWDADQIVPDNWPALLKLKDTGVKILSATTFVWVGNKQIPWRLRLNQYSLDEKGQCFNIGPASKDQPYYVPIVGTACMAIHRDVFDKLGKHPFRMTHQESQKIKAGEDVNFCVDAQKAGVQILVHPGIIFDHVKPLPLMQVGETISGAVHAKISNLQPTIEQMLSVG